MSQSIVNDKKRLVAECQSGSKEAQGLLYTTYRRKMLKVIRQYVADYDMAQDILHDGFLIILSQIQSLQKPDSLDYWMATIMKNLAIHTLSQIEFEDILNEQEEVDEDEIINDVSYDELMALIEQLPLGYKTVFRLAVLEGKSHQEIADMLGISPKSSASQLSRAKEKLRQLITEHRKKAGLLAILLFVVSISYYYCINIYIYGDVTTTEIVRNEKNQQHVKDDKQDIEFIKSDILNALTKSNESVSKNTADSILIASGYKDSNIILCETVDSVGQHSDTTKIVQHKDMVATTLYAEKEIKYISHPHDKKWSVNVTTNALGVGSSSNDVKIGNGPMADPDPNGGSNSDTKEETTSVQHRIPLTIGVRVSKELSPKWGLETGVQYSLLRSDITNNIGDWSYVKNVKAHYISIPIAARYHFLHSKRTDVYATSGMSFDLPVGSTIDSEITDEHSKLHYPISFSFSSGIGFEIQISPTTTLFIQPSLNYHIMNKSEHPILWQDQPLSFELPIGIRFSW